MAKIQLTDQINTPVDGLGLNVRDLEFLIFKVNRSFDLVPSKFLEGQLLDLIVDGGIPMWRNV